MLDQIYNHWQFATCGEASLFLEFSMSHWVSEIPYLTESADFNAAKIDADFQFGLPDRKVWVKNPPCSEL